MSREAAIAELVAQAQRLVDCVTFDESGHLIGKQWIGGNGGLIGRDTLRENELLRFQIENWNKWYAGNPVRDAPGPDDS